MTWAQIILAILSLLEWFIRVGQENKWIEVGRDREIAKQLAEITRKTNHAQQVLAEVSQLDDAGVDALLRTLEGPRKTEG